MISLDELDQLVSEVEQTDPLDCADLSLSEPDLRRLSCMGALQMLSDMEQQHLDNDAQFHCLLACVARLLADNTVLHARLLQRCDPGASSLQAVLSKMRRGPG